MDEKNNKMTPEKLDDISKKGLKNYMNDIKANGGIDYEQALYGLLLQIVVTLETQHGKVDAKRVVKQFVEDLYETP